MESEGNPMLSPDLERAAEDALATYAAREPFSPRRMTKDPAPTHTAPRVGSSTPWGPALTARPVHGLPGAVDVTTASHGGIWLPPNLVERMPEGHRRTWHEEDCEAVVVLYALEVPARPDYPGGADGWREDLRAVVGATFPEVLL